MDDASRTQSPFSEDFDEFDRLLEEDADVAPAPRRRSTRTHAADEEFDFDDDTTTSPTPRGRGFRSALGKGAKSNTKKATKIGSSTGGNVRLAPDWNRLAAVVFVAILIIVVGWFTVSSIRDSRRAKSYENYFRKTREIATQSNAQGTEFTSILVSNDGGDRAQRIQQLEDLATRASKLRASAEQLKAPKQLEVANRWLVTSLDYRARGVESVQHSITEAMEQKNKQKAAATVSGSFTRLVAGDVVWADSFAAEGRAVLKRDGVRNVTVPDSAFVTDLDAIGPSSVTKMLDRLRVATTKTAAGTVEVPKDGKIRGGAVEGGRITVQPSGKTLSLDQLTEIKGGADVVFEVPFTNQGEVQLTEVPVTVTLRSKNSDTIELTGVIDSVDPGETASANVALGSTPTFGEVLTMDVYVGPIPGEKTEDNNRASFQVQFAL